MNKTEYFERSFEQGLPNRCPILDYCQRRMWTIYFFNNYPNKVMFNALSEDGVLPVDYEQKEIKVIGEFPEISRGEITGRFSNMCPEVNLFDKQNCLNYFAETATTDGVWDNEYKGETKIIEQKHYSECGEYSKYHYENFTSKINTKQKINRTTCYLYLMINLKNGYHKIGIAFEPIYREKTLQSEEPDISTVKVRMFANRKIATEVESELHKKYEHKRVRGEWFDLNPIELEELYKFYEL